MFVFDLQVRPNMFSHNSTVFKVKSWSTRAFWVFSHSLKTPLGLGSLHPRGVAAIQTGAKIGQSQPGFASVYLVLAIWRSHWNR
jgi:hypothetical protein